MGCLAPNIRERLLASSAGEHWRKVGPWPHHGVAIPLFSLHSQRSYGIGEYPDLIPFIDWCREVGMDNLQLLPLNDTGRSNSPYSALTATALHPIYIGIDQLPFVSDHLDLLDRLKPLRELSQKQRVSYEEVLTAKEGFLRDYFHRIYDKIAQQPQYQEFLSTNATWLNDYSLFKAIREQQKGVNWEAWPEELKNPHPESLGALFQQHREAITFHQFVQYLCHQQMREVKQHAADHQFLIQGDIPILINRDSVDVWRHRQLFDLSLSAGSPPDMYSSEGQNWGFPIYAWPEHEKDNYQWWRMRLISASALYDLYRLDHAVGFFKIWAIPQGHLGNEGQFMPEDHGRWVPEGEKILHMLLSTTTMMPIAEDLGSVPSEVRACLQHFGICGTKVMRWERRWNEDKRFIALADYIPEGMTTVSTHDSEPLQLWWQKHRDGVIEYCQLKGWEYHPQLSFAQRKEILQDSHHTPSLFHINPLQEYLALYPELIWPNPEDERVNVPGVVSDHNWTYRFKPSIEELMQHNALKANIAEIIAN